MRNRSPKLTTKDRILFGFLANFITHSRLHKIAVAVKPATILKFHKALVKRKYKLLHSNKEIKKPGRRGPSQDIIKLVVDIKQKNPRYGYRRIAMQVYQSFGVVISCFTVGRILRKHYHPLLDGNNNGPSWLIIERKIGSVRCEFLDHTLFWNKYDLHKKLSHYKDYFNSTRGHWNLDQLTPDQHGKGQNRPHQTEILHSYGWKSHCNGLFQAPVAA